MPLNMLLPFVVGAPRLWSQHHCCCPALLQDVVSRTVTASANFTSVPVTAAVYLQASFIDMDFSSGSNPSGSRSASGRTNGSRGTCPLAQQCGLAQRHCRFLHASTPYIAIECKLGQRLLTFGHMNPISVSPAAYPPIAFAFLAPPLVPPV